MSRHSATFQVPTVPNNPVRNVSRPSAEEIAFRAHQIFLERGATPGLELDDWLQAERELTAAAQLSNSPKKPALPSAPLANARASR